HRAHGAADQLLSDVSRLDARYFQRFAGISRLEAAFVGPAWNYDGGICSQFPRSTTCARSCRPRTFLMKQPGDSRKSRGKSKSSKNPAQSSKGTASLVVVPEQRPRIGLEAVVEKIVLREWTLAHYNPQLPPVLS